MQDLTGKTALITGSTDGLGKLTAERLAARGATVLLHGRNPEKGERILSSLKRNTGSTDLQYYNSDFSSLVEVNSMCDTIMRRHAKLDLLINNAGIGGGPRGTKNRELSRDGYELRFAVNYLSHFLLTYKLLSTIKAAAPSRIVNVSSIGQQSIDFDNLMLDENYESFRAYRQSKLAQIMFTIDLAEEMKATGVVVNCLHPATLMNTNMVHEFFGSTMSTVEDGADALEYVATSEETAKVTGIYFSGKYESTANDHAYNADARRQLRELSLSLIQKYLSKANV